MVCGICAETADMPTASSAAAPTLCKNVLVSIMRFPPSFLSAGIFGPVRSTCSSEFLRLDHERHGASGRNDANARGERLRHHELAVRDLERKCRQGARGRAIDHRSALARIIM